MLNIIDKSNTMQSIDDNLINNFRAKFSGELIDRDHAEYDESRAVWNGMIDRYPAVIARCMRVEDVVAAVNFVREHQLRFSVRGGGHHVAGAAVCDDGVVIDLQFMKDIEVDPDARRVRVGGGATWGDVDGATQPYGLATPGGVVTTTGVAGLTLGGGYGWQSRKNGLACDNLVSAQIVTAQGEVITASESENEDLFWAIRGGSGNFGIVTQFEFELHPVGPDIFFAFVMYPAAKEVLQAHREFMANAPDEIMSIAVLGKVPHDDMFPSESHGDDYVALLASYIGDPAEGEKALLPIRELGTPIVDFSDVMPFVEVQQFYDADYPAGELRYYWKSTFLDALSDEAIDTALELAAQMPSHHSTLDIWFLGGAVSRVDQNATAFSHRQYSHMFGIEANWEAAEDDATNLAWARGLWQASQQFSQKSATYVNFEDMGEDHSRRAFGSNYERMAAIKAQYDPNNLFSNNHNVKPSN